MDQFAQILDEAALQAEAIPQISLSSPLSLADAYQVQDLLLQKCVDRGEQVVGVKLGFTSLAKMEQMGVKEIIWGSLTDRMRFHSGDEVPIENFIHPRAEPEIAFLIGKTIDGPISLQNVEQYVQGVAVAVEVIDSRYRDFKFSLEDVVADNCSSAAFTIGSWYPASTPIRNIKISLSFNNEIVETGNSSAILGDPWNSLINAVDLLRSHNRMLKAGEIVLAGAATAARFFESGFLVEAHAEGLGSVGLRIV